MPVKPFTPTEAQAKQQTSIPDEVIQAVNELLAENYDSVITLKQTTIALRAVRLAKRKFTSNQLFDNGWMNIEPIYRKYGWDVEYDKPGFNEEGEAFFRFTKKGK